MVSHALLLFARQDVRIFARIMSEADALERGMCLGLGLAPDERFLVRRRHCRRHLLLVEERPNQAGWPLLSSSASGSSSKGTSSSRRSGASSGFGMGKPGGKFESKRPAPLSSVRLGRSWI